MNKNKCTIVMYHYVRNMHETDFPDLKGRLIDDFKKQLDFISKNYNFISLKGYIDYINGKSNIPERTCILTFDDGFKDHYTHCFPELKKRKIPAIFYICTQPLREKKVLPVHKLHFLLAKLGPEKLIKEYNLRLKESFPNGFEEFSVSNTIKKDEKYIWDNNLIANLKVNAARMDYEMKLKIFDPLFLEYVGEEERFSEQLYMNKEEITEMIEQGFEFGGHSETHPRLSPLKPEEIKESKEWFELEFGIKLTSFSYPYGDHNEIVKKITQEAGYDNVTGTDVGINDSNIDLFNLKRLDTNNIPLE